MNHLCQQVLEHHVSAPSSAALQKEGSGVIAQITEALGDSLQGVVLFGSVARGSARKSSDIDLLVVLHSGQKITRRLYVEWDARFPQSSLSPHFVHLPDHAADAGSVWLEASVDGIIWHDPHGKVSRTLAGIRRVIASGLISRREAYGLPYWVRKGGERHVQ